MQRKSVQLIINGALAGLGVILLQDGALAATPFRLEYNVNALGGGLYDYDFSLILDNNDASWVPGQQFDWLIFGDAPQNSTSPLTSWIGDLTRSDSRITFFTDSIGGHNGPTIFPAWQPSAIGDVLKWAGTSTADLEQGQLLWSNLIGSSGASRADFETALRVVTVEPNPNPVPTPALLPGLIGMGVAALRKKGKKEELVGQEA